MTRQNNQNNPLSLDTPIDEDRVRRALGLKTGGAPHQQRPEQARQRHRFVADGAVPVVMLNRADGETTGLKERIASLETTLDTERNAHAATRRALSDAHAAHQTLQTRLSHTELSHGEALKAERAARRTAEEALAALRAERPERPRRVPKSVIVEHAEALGASASEPGSAQPMAAKPGRKPRLTAAPREAKPVRWWTPSFRNKKS